MQDESHLLIKGASAKIEAANFIRSKFRWGVTATPMTSSIYDLSRQLRFAAGSFRCYGDLLSLEIAMESFNKTEDTFNKLVRAAKRVIIRHTKSQRINGSEALALPPSTTSTVLLDMSAVEDTAFNKVQVSPSVIGKYLKSGVGTFSAERCFAYPMNKILRSGEFPSLREFVFTFGSMRGGTYCYDPERLTKIVALRTDLASFRQREPNLRAVVYTQSLDVHAACVRGLKSDGYDVFQFTGGSSSCRRDEAIRNFQNENAERPAVFVVTLRSGNVGITLTAASRVYLLEPCLDPAVEVQAAGRIHRLGESFRLCNNINL